ncbi:MAG: cyclase family protein [Candidatus Omnitrophica bacterium]|nr:cyclase family protein [Candidatus Omnitrophota bacterium]
MKIIDLTRKISQQVTTRYVPIKIAKKRYQGVIHDFFLSSMSGTYIDFPGHLAEFDNGLDAATYPVERLFMVETTVIHLERKNQAREIAVQELEKLAPSVVTPGLLINTGWKKEIYHPEVYFYSRETISWIVNQKISLFISDVYENQADPQGIFVEFFKAGIATVCLPENLEKITSPRVKICVFPLAISKATQVPCRILAIEE